jgi:ABC-type transport system involved in multi-copper enzyme maturation permease subunit
VTGAGAALVIVGYALRESLRRRVFLVVLVLTVGFLALYGVGAYFAFRDVKSFVPPDENILDPTAFTGATVFGLAMFAILFLGSVVAIFLTLGVVRGDAEAGLLQPIVVRPIGRRTIVLARLGGAAIVSVAYVLVVYALALAIIAALGGWTPDHVVGPALALALAVVTVAAISLFASVFMSATAQGIAVFMVLGTGLTAGLLDQIGRALNSDSLHTIGRVATWALPFDGLYQAGLHALTSETSGLTGVVLQLGPFGGAEGAGPLLVLWTVAYTALVAGGAALAFARQDL